MLGHRLGTTLVAIVAIALPLVACGGDDDAGGDTTTTEPPKTTTTAAPTTTLSPEQQAQADVRAAYDAYWAMSERLAAAPDPQDPEIAELVTGTAATTLTDHLTTLTAQRRAVQFGEDYAHAILAVELGGDGTSAVVSDCYVDHSAEVDAQTGGVIREATFTNRFDVTLALESGTWKVSRIERLAGWEGVTTCE